jgi:Ser-tRNA(Ala) deacylase AlaX
VRGSERERERERDSLVRIEGLDVNTCCGTHLASLAEIQV